MRIVLGCLLAMFVAQLPPTASDQGIINGRVTFSGGAEGVPNVSVLLVGPLSGTAANAATSNPLMIEEIAEGSGARAIRTTTAVDGRFAFRNLPPGPFMLKVQQDGFLSAVPTVTGGLVSMATVSVTLANATDAAEVRIPLLKASAFSGKVRDSSGLPMSNAAVVTYQAGYRDGRRALVQASSSRTDDRGEYRFFNQPPGEYYLAVSNNASAFRPPVLAAATNASGWCCRTFYPSALDASSAVPLRLGEGAEVTGLDIDMRSRETFRISGKISGPVLDGVQGSAAVTPSVSLAASGDSLDPDNGFDPALSITPEGTFELRGVPSGSYDLVATVAAGGRTYPGRVRVNVASRDVEGVNVAISPGTEVRLRVLVDGNVAIEPGIRLQLLPPEAYGSSRIGLVAGDAAGIYTLQRVPEGVHSLVRTGLPANSYVADIREGAKSVYDAGLVVGKGPMGQIDVVVKSGAASIRGTVRNAEGKPAASANVVLVPPPARRQDSSLYRTFRTDASGAFALSGIAPGEYKLFAWQSLPNTAHLNSAFMEKYESRGHSVTIAEGGNHSFELNLIPAER